MLTGCGVDCSKMYYYSAAQKGYFLTENSFDGVSYVYGRNGHLMLGDSKGHGGCIVTPYVDAMRSDSLLMVSFRAVARRLKTLQKATAGWQ